MAKILRDTPLNEADPKHDGSNPTEPIERILGTNGLTSQAEPESASSETMPLRDGQEHHYEASTHHEPDEHETRMLAYFLWEGREASHGSADDDWYRAKEELRSRRHRAPSLSVPTQPREE
jgi:hypothetical protein